jgi:alpha-ketoglutarate-dependent taurine dioxygenase
VYRIAGVTGGGGMKWALLWQRDCACPSVVLKCATSGGMVHSHEMPANEFFMNHCETVRALHSPFDLDDDASYQRWRSWKLGSATTDAAQLLVKIADTQCLQADEITQIEQRCARFNMALYEITDGRDDKALVQQLGEQLGLSRLDTNLRADEDSVTSLQVRPQLGNQYIPYTNKPLSWHTDGYYNPPQQQVRAFIVHCVTPAASGGSTALLDPELLYIRLRDENPGYIKALMHPQAMTIPPNVEQGEELRGARTGPVFSVDAESGCLHLRYSARQRNIEWREDALTQQATQRITGLLDDETLVVRFCLNAGQGIICNNVLHNRTGFEDSASQQRLMYRARYYDRVTHTGIDSIDLWKL